MCANPVRGLLLVAFVSLGQTEILEAQSELATSAAKKNAVLFQLLREEVNLAGFEIETLNLREFFEILKDIHGRRGNQLSIVIDTEAFKVENPDGADLRETTIKLPARATGFALLKAALRQIPEENAVFLLRGGVVEITTRDSARSERLLTQKIHASFEQQPLRNALAELAALGGVSIVLDPFAGKGSTIPVTAVFHGDVTLLSSVVMLCDMADLKAVVVDGGLYVTSPVRARQMLNQLWQQQSVLIRSQFARLPVQERASFALQQTHQLHNEFLVRAMQDADPIIRWAAHVTAQERNHRQIDPFASATTPPQ